MNFSSFAPAIPLFCVALVGCGAAPDRPVDGQSAALATTLDLPAPTGPHKVGRETRVLVDASRAEASTPDPNDRRKILLSLWYPRAPGDLGAPVPYLAAAEADALGTAYFGQLGLVMPQDWESGVHTETFAAGPLHGAGRLPVVVFSHGLSALGGMYASFVGDLASHGFVVAVIHHAYDTEMVVFPDGGTAPFQPTFGPFPPPDAPPVEMAAFEQLLDEHIGVWAADVRFVLDQLEDIDDHDPQHRFTHRLDMDHVGMYGHSYGGAATGEAIFADPRIKAGVVLDGTMYSPVRLSGSRALSVPVLFQVGDPPPTGADTSIVNTYEKLTHEGYMAHIEGTAHGNYWDLSLVTERFAGPDALSFLWGPIDRVRAVRISNAYTLAFFEKHLLGKCRPLLDGPSAAHPEVTLQTRNTTSSGCSD